ncbi:MAG: hypothetical protein HC802_16580 [Caldilineaceae bacterium]|nr:hypothetical protein [Caldilineaceae bacterium]
MSHKPDIYLIFIESYGSVLYKRDDFRAAYLELLQEIDNQLDAAGWQSASALSESPTWGGGSWMAYTSALFGYRIDSHPQFLSLFNKYQIDQFPDLGRYLQAQGYEHVRLSSISTELKEEEWLRYRNFYGVDRWLRSRDLGYVGPGYGWGPARRTRRLSRWAWPRSRSTGRSSNRSSSSISRRILTTPGIPCQSWPTTGDN